MKFKSTKLMKAHLGNPNLHTTSDRSGIEFSNENKRIVGCRKVRKQKKTVSRRKRVKLNDKKRWVELIYTELGNSDNNIDSSITQVTEIVRAQENSGIKRSQLVHYLAQRERLNRKFPNANRSRVDGGGRKPDSFLYLKLPEIKRILLFLRRVPNVNQRIFFMYVDEKYPE